MKRIFIYIMLFLPYQLFAQVDKIEYFFDLDPGYGLGIDVEPAQIIENNANGILQSISFNAPIISLGDGFHNFYARALAKNGWSQTQAVPFFKMTLPGEDSAEVDYIECFFDEDPGYKAATSLEVTNIVNGQYAYNVDLSNLIDGFHTFYIRALNKYGQWSQVMSSSIYKTTLPDEFSKEIIYTEYYFDNDPGKGNGLPFPYNPIQQTIDFTAILDGLSLGNHTIYLRGQYKNNIWETMGKHSFSIVDGTGLNLPEVNFSVYPNPVVESLFIKNNDSNISKIELLNNSGQLLNSWNLGYQSIIQIPFTSQQAGIYFIRVYFNEGIVRTHKLIKQ